MATAALYTSSSLPISQHALPLHPLRLSVLPASPSALRGIEKTPHAQRVFLLGSSVEREGVGTCGAIPTHGYVFAQGARGKKSPR
jgi:hypothetical protein